MQFTLVSHVFYQNESPPRRGKIWGRPVRCGLSSKLFAHLFILVSVFVSGNRTATLQLGWRADWASNESAGPGQARPGRRHLGRQGVRTDRRRRPLNNWAAAPRGRAVGTTLLLLGDRTFPRPLPSGHPRRRLGLRFVHSTATELTCNNRSSSSSSSYTRLFRSCQTQLIQNTSIKRKEI